MLTRSQIDRLNLEGYANLDHWVAELDKRIEGILLQRLTTIIHVWCAEFDRTEDDVRRDTTVTMKRRGERRKDEKVRRPHAPLSMALNDGTDRRGRARAQADRARDPDPEPGHLPRPADRVRAADVDPAAARVARCARRLVWARAWLTFRTGVVCQLRRIQSSRYEIGLQMQGTATTEANYTSLVRATHGASPLARADGRGS
jgi:hypothetical protein